MNTSTGVGLLRGRPKRMENARKNIANNMLHTATNSKKVLILGPAGANKYYGSAARKSTILLRGVNCLRSAFTL